LNVAAFLAARKGLEHGLSVVPPRQDGSKAPVGEWKPYQSRRPTPGMILDWYRQGFDGVGVVCGLVSGGLEMFEFEGRAIEAGVADRFDQLAIEAGRAALLARLKYGYLEQTPTGGLHLLYRCPAPTSKVLARDAAGKVLIETKGEGGYTVIAPSAGPVHPTGGRWERLAGDLGTIPIITPEERDALWDLARAVDAGPGKSPAARRVAAPSSGGNRPGDDFERRGNWVKILEPHGWKALYTASDGRQHWCRPGKESGTSATVSDYGRGVLYVFTSSSAFVENTSYGKFAAYAALNFANDYSAAARALQAEGYGDLEHSEPDNSEDVPVEPGAKLLDDLVRIVSRFVAMPEPAYADVVALWILHTHAIAAAESTPRLSVQSAEKRSGKTRLLELLNLLVREPMFTVNTSVAALYRSVEASMPTVLLDEVDTIYGSRASENEDLRGLLNAGHRRDAAVRRCVGEGKKMEVKDFPVFCPVALAGIGGLPDTITDRSIVLRMKRRARSEEVEEFRARRVEPEASALRRRLQAWAARSEDSLSAADPEMPSGIVDRTADVWEPLLAIADVAGGSWPQRARSCALKLNEASPDNETSPGVRLLADIRACFEVAGTDRLMSAELVAHLVALDEAPWGDLRGRPLNAQGLAGRLRPYDIRSKKIRFGETCLQGYELGGFTDAFFRYLPNQGGVDQRAQAERAVAVSAVPAPEQPEQSEQRADSSVPLAEPSAPHDQAHVPPVPDVPDHHRGTPLTLEQMRRDLESDGLLGGSTT